MLKSSSESPGSNCTFGGTRVDAGVDADDNNVLDPSEISNTAFVCQTSASWSVVTADTAMQSNTSYIASGAGEIRFTLPASPAVGDVFAVSGSAGGGWAIVPGVGQTIITSTIASIPVSSTDAPIRGAQYASIQLQYIGSGIFMPLSAFGRISNGYISQGGLTWSPANTALDWGAASAYCAGTINGTTGWRLPTQAELVGLINSSTSLSGIGWSLRFTWTSTAGGVGEHVGADTGQKPAAPYAFTDSYDAEVTCVK